MDEKAAKFVMEFVEASDAWRQQFEAIWQETLDNFFVRPIGSNYVTSDPFRQMNNRLTSVYSDRFVLKDPETHRTVMKYASSLMRTIFGDKRGEYIQAAPVGYEDVLKASTTTKLLRARFGLRGVYRTYAEGFTDLPIFGTTIIRVGQIYKEAEISVRTVSADDDVRATATVAVRDGPDQRQVGIMDFFPDPYECRIERMCGAAERSTVSPYYADYLAQTKVWNADAVEAAKSARRSGLSRDTPLSSGYPDRPQGGGPNAPLTLYTFHGEYTDGTRRTIDILEGECARNRTYIYADTELPWYDLVLNPVAGRFYGLAPAEVLRYDQDLADCLKELAARAAIRAVHPPIAYDPDSGIDKDLLQQWFADKPIPVRGGPNSVGTLEYKANVGQIFAMRNSLTADMQGGAGTSNLLGDPGPDRESASVGAMRFQAASDIMEFAAGVLERDALPAIAMAVLRRDQQFLDEADLPRLVGEQPEFAWIGDIMGEFDIQFQGSRLAATRAQKLAAYDRLIALSQVPSVQLQIPWQKLLGRMIGDLMELPEVAAAVGTEAVPNAIAMALAQGQKGAPASASPSQAITPAQGAGASIY
jgi:hypothetical protein